MPPLDEMRLVTLTALTASLNVSRAPHDQLTAATVVELADAQTDLILVKVFTAAQMKVLQQEADECAAHQINRFSQQKPPQ